MKKTFLLASIAFCIISSGAVASNKIANEVSTTSNPNEHSSTGTVSGVSDDGITIIDHSNGETFEVAHPGARIEYIIGDAVSYRLITLPTGKVIVKDIRRPA
jgi:hypothetical protein